MVWRHSARDAEVADAPLPLPLTVVCAGVVFATFLHVGAGPAFRRVGVPLAGVAAGGFLAGGLIVLAIKERYPHDLVLPRTPAGAAAGLAPDLLLGGCAGLAWGGLCSLLAHLFVEPEHAETPGEAFRLALGAVVPIVASGLLGGVVAGVCAAVSRRWSGM